MENKAQQSDSVDVTRPHSILQEESPTDYITDVGTDTPSTVDLAVQVIIITDMLLT